MLGLPPPYIVAYSGGADSTALLLMALEAAAGEVSAVHVHHGLQAAADDFAAHCEAFCQAHGAALTVLRVDASAQPGQSPEDAARSARYGAIASHALARQPVAPLPPPSIHPIHSPHLPHTELEPEPEPAVSPAQEPTVLLAQHSDDQVETLLLALARGAGVDGLAGMAARFTRHGIHWARPFLDASMAMGAQEIRQWLGSRGLSARNPGSGNLGRGWVEDPSNQSLRFTRNRVRAQLIPALAQVFPQYRDTFSRVARNMAQAQQVMAQSAMDLESVVGLPPRIAALQSLPRAQQANYLRHWLKSQHQTAGSQAQLNELLDQVAACTTRGHAIQLKVGQGTVFRQADTLGFNADFPSGRSRAA